MATPRFAIYYADGSCFEGGGADDELVTVSLEVSRDWLTAPDDRVLGIIIEHPDVGRKVYRGFDHYYQLGDGELGQGDSLAAWARKFLGAVKNGEYVSSKTMARMWAWVKSYTRIPRGNGVRLTNPDNQEPAEKYDK